MRPLSCSPRALSLLTLAVVVAQAGCSGPAAPGQTADAAAPADATVVAPRDLSVPPHDLTHRCARDTDCAGGLHCDVTSGQCVACVADGNCAPGDRCLGHQCLPGCTRAHGCGDAGVCEADAGACVECLADRDCKSPDRPRCEPDGRRCVPCLLESDNCPDGTYCALGGGSYACEPGCRRDADCRVDGGALRCAVSSHTCVPCLLDGDCPLGQLCANNACVPGCTQQHPCQPPATCCGGACVDMRVDPLNCGACGTACNQGTTCCTGACADVTVDPKNCGSCGAACNVPNAMPGCAQGACTLKACNDGFADCDGVANNGCEVLVAADVKNCGKCGTVCSLPFATPACVTGACSILMCQAGHRDCDGLPGTGCETDTFNDNQNCGTCGQVCNNLPHASATCSMGGCVVSSCGAGYGNCDHLDANGCETDITVDPRNCSACGMACATPPNKVATCVASTCGVGGCQPGFGDCNLDPADGCEANFATDAANCGGCGMGCANGAVCVSSKCSSV